VQRITVNGANKMRHAQEALLRWINAGRKAGEQLTIRMLLALLTLHERYLEKRLHLHKNGGYERLTCECKTDRMVLTTPNRPWRVLEDLGYRSRPPQRLWDQSYRSISRLRGTKSIRDINVEHQPNAGWLAPYRITIIPRDATGVEPQDFRAIVEVLPDLKIVLLEIALDFPLDSIIDTDYVRRHLLSGKMWLRQASNQNKFHQRWGPSTGRMAVRTYAKWAASTMRVELELHARFLRDKEVKDLFDFQRLAGIILSKKHIWFGQIDEKKLMAQLRRKGIGKEEQRKILQQVETREPSLWEILRFLRRTTGLKNVRRLLRPLDDVNQVIADAIGKWAAQWQANPTRLVKK
jgi:hypothetical protein